MGLLLEGSWFTPMPEFLCHHQLETPTASPVGNKKWPLVSGGSSSLLHRRGIPAVGSGLSSPPGLSNRHFREYPSGFSAVGKQGVLQVPAWGEACCLHHAGQHLLQKSLGAFKVTDKHKRAENSSCSRKAPSGLKNTEQELC